jgi:hypothetical protein
MWARAREEINFEPAGFVGGRNYGWNCREGFIAYDGCSGAFTNPIYDYGHCSPCSNTPGTGNSITGGFVYRGTNPANEAMRGYYICGDYVSRHGWMIKYNPGSPVESRTISRLTPGGVTTFGETENGEILAGQSNGELGLIESTETALPFKLSRFQANWIRPRVELRWSNQSEADLEIYTIEKSKDGLRFLSIGEVIPKHNDQHPNEYVFRDDQIESSENYYAKTDRTDHSVDYSDIVRFLVPDTTNFWLTGPPPEAPSRNDFRKRGSVVYPIHGNWVMQVPGDQSIAADHLAGGIYILVVNTGKEGCCRNSWYFKDQARCFRKVLGRMIFRCNQTRA